MAVQKFANDPEVRAKLARIVKEEILPRAEQGWEQVKPEREKVKDKVRDLAKKLTN
jgi:hypothetical protein